MRIALAGVLAAGMVGALAAPAQAGRSMEIGLQDDSVFLTEEYYDRELALAQARELNVTRIRVNVVWARVLGPKADTSAKPRTLEYNWKPYDELIDAAARYGIRLQPTLTAPGPRWAMGNRRSSFPNVSPSPRYFAEFAREAATHFQGRVDRYTIWNEPNFKSWLSPQRSAPRIYRRLYEAAYAEIKRADPQAKVLMGETSPYGDPGKAIAPVEFLRKVVCRRKDYSAQRNCQPLKTDGYAHHPYEFKYSPRRPFPGEDNATMSGLRNLTRGLDQLKKVGALTNARGGRVPIYLTEFGYHASGRRQLGAAKRAKYLPLGFEMAQRHPRVRQMTQYVLVAPKQPTEDIWDTSLISRSGEFQPPWYSLLAWSRQAAAARRIAVPGPPIELRPAPAQDPGMPGAPPPDRI